MLKGTAARADVLCDPRSQEPAPVPPARKPNIDTCNACGKLFPRVGMRLCTACSLNEHHRFALVREYLDAHGGGSIADIAATTCVSASDVRRFVEGGRLVSIEPARDARTGDGRDDTDGRASRLGA